MIKRDLNAWDFVKNKPKTKLRVVGGGTNITWDDSNIQYNYNYQVNTNVENTVLLGFNGEGLRVDANNQVTINDLVVAGSAEIPPQEGQMMYDVNDNLTYVFVGDTWQEINWEPVKKESLWSRFKTFIKNLLA
jgi:hypothetical protein